MAEDYNHTDEYADELARHDARDRAWRTLWQGLALDVTLAAVLFLHTATEDIAWTSTYWRVLGLTLAKTVIQTTLASLMRRIIPPKHV